MAAAATSGDNHAFERVYRREIRNIRLILRIALDPDTAQDAEQEVFERARRRLESFDPDRGTFRLWLAGIAANVVREERRRKSRVVLCEPLELVDHQDRSNDASDDIDRYVTVAWVRDELVPLMRDRLTPAQAEAFALVTVLDYSQQEAAVLMGISYGSLRLLLMRGLRKLNGLADVASGGDLREQLAMTRRSHVSAVVAHRRRALWRQRPWLRAA